MIGKEIIEERDVTLSETKHILSKRKKEGELSYEQKLTYDYVSEFGKPAMTKCRAAVEDLMKIGKIDESLATMIVDNKPDDKDDLRLIMEKKRYGLSEEDIKKVLTIVKDLQK